MRYPAHTTRQSAPLRRIGTFGLAVSPLVPCMGFLLSSGFRTAISFSAFFIGFFVRPGNPVSSSRPAVFAKPARAGAVKVGRRTNLSTSFGLARPYLDSSEHGGTLDAIGITIRGEPAFRARRSIAPQPCIRWVQDPNHDAVIRISGEAPRRRTHSFPRHKSHGTSRDPATSNRHRRPVTSGRTRPETVGCLQRPPFIAPGAERCHPAPRLRAPVATRRSEVCAPRPRSWSCEYRGHSRYGLETTAPRHCPSGT